MTTVLCSGPESSGTRLLCRIVEQFPGVHAVHRSIPHGGEWPDLDGEWDRAVFVVRGWFETLASQKDAGHLRVWREWDPEERQREAIRLLSSCPVPWILLTYEGLVARPQATADRIARWLGVASAPVPERIYDGNERR